MLVLAILFPIHFFFVGRIGWGLFYWLGGAVLVFPWIVGMVKCRTWTDEYNRARSEEYALAMAAWDRAQSS